MANFENVTHEEIAFLLGYFYPGMIWSFSGLSYEGLIVHPESPVPKPTFEDIQSHVAEAKQLIIQRRAYETKVDTFQRTYPMQDQIVNIMTAMAQAGNFAEFKNNATLVAMRQLWNSL